MSRDKRNDRQIAALFLSLSLHVAAAAIVMWMGAQSFHVAGEESRSVTDRLEPSQEPPT